MESQPAVRTSHVGLPYAQKLTIQPIVVLIHANTIIVVMTTISQNRYAHIAELSQR